MASFHLIVGTFNTPSLYTLSFTPPTRSSSSSSSSKGSVKILKRHDAVGSHSWLALSSDAKDKKKNLYATAWLEPPSVAAYSIDSPTDIRLLNTAPTQSRSGYVCCSNSHVYSAGGATGEVFAIDSSTGAFTIPDLDPKPNGTAMRATNGISHAQIHPVQRLDFLSDQPQRDNGSTMDFGGLRHGAHSADLSPDGKYLYIADIGRNCVWTYSIAAAKREPHLALVEKHISPRPHDGPRHVWPHPNGKVVYVLQEHSSVVDVFVVDSSTGLLTHVQGVRIIPLGLPVDEFWADEVRTSLSDGDTPRYLYASTRGLKEGRKGYVAVYKLDEEGRISGAKSSDAATPAVQKSGQMPDDQDQGGLLCMYETVTSGGWANAVQPGPTVDGVEYLALTDSEVGYVFVLGWNGQTIQEVGRVNLNDDIGSVSNGHDTPLVVGAATAVWL